MSLKEEFDIILDSLGLPVAEDVYNGTATEYFVVNYSDERPIEGGDGEDLLDRVTVQVHYYFKTNPCTNKKKIRKLLRVAGYSILNTERFYENNTKYTHIVVEACIDEENTDLEED